MATTGTIEDFFREGIASLPDGKILTREGGVYDPKKKTYTSPSGMRESVGGIFSRPSGGVVSRGGSKPTPAPSPTPKDTTTFKPENITEVVVAGPGETVTETYDEGKIVQRTTRTVISRSTSREAIFPEGSITREPLVVRREDIYYKPSGRTVTKTREVGMEEVSLAGTYAFIAEQVGIMQGPKAKAEFMRKHAGKVAASEWERITGRPLVTTPTFSTPGDVLRAAEKARQEGLPVFTAPGLKGYAGGIWKSAQEESEKFLLPESVPEFVSSKLTQGVAVGGTLGVANWFGDILLAQPHPAGKGFGIAIKAGTIVFAGLAVKETAELFTSEDFKGLSEFEKGEVIGDLAVSLSGGYLGYSATRLLPDMSQDFKVEIKPESFKTDVKTQDLSGEPWGRTFKVGEGELGLSRQAWQSVQKTETVLNLKTISQKFWTDIKARIDAKTPLGQPKITSPEGFMIRRGGDTLILTEGIEVHIPGKASQVLTDLFGGMSDAPKPRTNTFTLGLPEVSSGTGQFSVLKPLAQTAQTQFLATETLTTQMPKLGAVTSLFSLKSMGLKQETVLLQKQEHKQEQVSIVAPMLKYSFEQGLALDLRQDLMQDLKLDLRQDTKQETIQLQVPDLMLDTKVGLDLKIKQVLDLKQRFDTPLMSETVFEPPRKWGLKFPDLELGRTKSTKRRGKVQGAKTEYKPSIAGMFSGRFVMKAPKLGTGVEMRYPIVKSRKKKKKRGDTIDFNFDFSF